jgi:hypothetical protein
LKPHANSTACGVRDRGGASMPFRLLLSGA